MLRMTEDHVLPELNKVVYNSIFPICVSVALVELICAGHLSSKMQLLLRDVRL